MNSKSAIRLVITILAGLLIPATSAEGATTLVVDGSDAAVEQIIGLVVAVKGSGVSGVETSFPECEFPSPMCKLHPTCLYRKKKAAES